MDLVRVDIALIPEDPLYSGVVAASEAITDEFYYNANIIDDTTFPPHLSLHICTVPRDRLNHMTTELAALAAAGLPAITPSTVESSHGGYVMLNITRTPELTALHDAVRDIAAKARDSIPSTDTAPTVRQNFTPHFSLAKLDRRDQAAATLIARRALDRIGTAESRTLDLCDIGEHSERWDILASLVGDGTGPT